MKISKANKDGAKSVCSESDQTSEDRSFSDLSMLRSFYEPASLPPSPSLSDKHSEKSEKSEETSASGRRLSLPTFTPFPLPLQKSNPWAFDLTPEQAAWP